MFGEENEIDYVKFWELTFGLAMCVCVGGGEGSLVLLTRAVSVE